MVGKKLIKILQSLDEVEFRRLKKALMSPYFATNPRLLTYYGLLKKYYPDFDDWPLEKEKLFRKLYPGKPYNDGLLRVLTREFTKVAEDFLLMEQLRTDRFLRQKQFVSAMGERNLYEYFQKGTWDLLNSLDDGSVKDMEYFAERIALLKEYCFHPLTNNYLSNDTSLAQLMDSLDGFFFLAKYRFAQVIKNRDFFLKGNTPLRFMEELSEDKYGLARRFVLIKIYDLVNKLHSEGDEKYFYKIKQLLFANIDKIKRTDLRIVYYIGLNYCSQQLKKGSTRFSAESLLWYKAGLRRGLLVENGKMSDATFLNIVLCSSREKQIEWAEHFMRKYQELLDDSIRVKTTRLAYSIILYFQGKHEDALQILTSHSFLKRHQITVRNHALKALFEMARKDFHYYALFFSYAEASLKYLERYTGGIQEKDIPVKRYIKILEKLARLLVNRKDPKKIKDWLRKEIDDEAPLAERWWLIEKYKELFNTETSYSNPKSF